MLHPYYHNIEVYPFLWALMFPFFYLVYLLSTIIVYTKLNKKVKIGFMIIVGAWLVYIFPPTDIHFFLFSLTGALFPVGLRYCQMHKKHYQGIKQKLNLAVVYVVFPLLATFFWPIYLGMPMLIEYWNSRPSSECKQNGRLISLANDAVYRLYPQHSRGNEFWVNMTDVTTKEFCDKFSATEPKPVVELSYSFKKMCRHPETPNQKAYCDNIKQGEILLSDVTIKATNNMVPSHRIWPDLQTKLNEDLNKQLTQGNTDLAPLDYHHLKNYKEFDNGVALYVSYDRNKYNKIYNIIINNPNWLHPQKEPFTLYCNLNYEGNQYCRAVYLYQKNAYIDYTYDLTETQKDEFTIQPQNYSQSYIDKQIAAAQKAHQIVTSIFEEMRIEQ
ncbi:hypothetical protein [Gilliamella sp. ESL0254]|uniref:hypothetical protein n=1 Tax=Gilliamella sp. ESL0254 TaxID=2705035 RepID=UPI00157FDB6C|nr:hypothetical protein [Gilliamella sp. ESL0254]NUF27178.1 hypothetical protein [Gilliamella sp. ESL0254]